MQETLRVFPFGHAVLVTLLVVLLVQCEGRELRLVSCSAGESRPVRLNETLTLRFSAPLQPRSVRPETVRVVCAADGVLVPGRLEVEENRVHFHPRHPMQEDLRDVAFRPGTRYRLELPGPPRLATVRDRRGNPLCQGAVFVFETVAAGLEAGRVFVDPEPQEGPRLIPGESRFRGQSFLIYFSEPLDPRALAAGTFRWKDSWYQASRPEESPELRFEWVRNDPHAVLRLQLDPATLRSPLVPGTEYSVLLPVRSIQDFGGRSLLEAGGGWELPLEWLGPGEDEGVGSPEQRGPERETER